MSIKLKLKHSLEGQSSFAQTYQSPMRPRLQVIFLGIVSLLLYLFLTHISKEFNWGEGYAERPILTYLTIYFSLSLLFFSTCAILLKQPEDRFTFWAIIVLGLLFRLSIYLRNSYRKTMFIVTSGMERFFLIILILSNTPPLKLTNLKNYEFRTLKLITKFITKEMKGNWKNYQL